MYKPNKNDSLKYCLGLFYLRYFMTTCNVPLCITLLVCICASAEHSCTKYFQIVRSGINRFCFLKCLIILARSPASASSSTMLSSLSCMKEARYRMTLGWSSCCSSWISFMQSRRALESIISKI